MKCNRTCRRSGTEYCFINTPRTFEQANNACNTIGGQLLTNTPTEIYRTLRCSNVGQYYWIGVRNSTTCNRNNKGRFEYVGSNQCVAFPNVTVPQNTVCFAAQVILPAPDIKTGETRIRSCKERSKYICRISQIETTPEITTLIYSEAETTENFTFTNQSTYTNTNTAATNANTAAIVAGVLLSILIIALILVFAYCWRYNKWNVHNLRNLRISRNCFVKSSDSVIEPPGFQAREDHMYYSVEPKVQGSRANSTTYSIVTDPAYPSPNAYSFAEDAHNDDPTKSQQYFESADTSISTIATYSIVNEPKNVSTANSPEKQYDGVFEPNNPTNEYAEVVNKPTLAEKLQTNISNATKLQSTLDTSSVEYSTVRSIDKPTEVYAVVNKAHS